MLKGSTSFTRISIAGAGSKLESQAPYPLADARWFGIKGLQNPSLCCIDPLVGGRPLSCSFSAVG